MACDSEFDSADLAFDLESHLETDWAGKTRRMHEEHGCHEPGDSEVRFAWELEFDFGYDLVETDLACETEADSAADSAAD